MNDDVITMNEVLNNGDGIYFYHEKNTGLWLTFGYSAYLLTLKGEVKYLESFSERMQMPCVSISESDFRELLRKNVETIECKDGYYYLPTESVVSADDYRNWVKKVR